MNVNKMNGAELANEVVRRFTEPDGTISNDSIWISDCQKRFGELNEDEREIFLSTSPKQLGGRKE